MKLMKKLLVAAAISGIALTNVTADDALVKKGEKIFKTKTLGNCIACHDANGKSIDGPGSMGPKLSGLTYWPEETLYDIVYDIYAAKGLKVTSMPAFGKNGWLDDAEIKAVVAYLKTIK